MTKARIVRSEAFDRIAKRTSLKIRLHVLITMSDQDNWKNGDYLGDLDKKLLQPILKEVEEWLNDKAPLR